MKLPDARNDKGKLTKISVRARLAEIENDKDMLDERKLLKAYLALTDDEAAANKALKDAQKALETKIAQKYRTLSVDEIKNLIVEDKWIVSLDGAIHGELDQISQQLTQRIKELAERYESSLPQIVSRVAEMESAVDGHLKQMGYTW
jgi:type I restriction enzyme M protein